MFSKATRAIGIDVGTHSVKVVQLSKAGSRFRLENVGYCPVDPARVNVDPIEAQAEALREALRTIPLSRSLKVGALPGQTVVIRYPRLPDMTDAELARAVDREATQNLPYELSEVFVDWTILDRGTEGDEKVAKILLVAAKHELIDSRVQIAASAGVQFNILGVDSLALADAAEGCDFLRVGETVALIDLGVTSTIIHFVRDGVSNFYRDVNWGARELAQAIMKAYRCDSNEAERRLRDSARPPAPAPGPGVRAVEPVVEIPDDDEPSGLASGFSGFDEIGETPAAPPESAPPPMPSLGGLEELGGSLLDPLDDEMGSAPTRPAAPPARAAAARQDEGPSIDDTLHGPLSRLVSEVRRSFDYYEQQLYERPVDRVILSGGVAHLPLVGAVLREELGFDQVEVADPSRSALVLGNESNLAPLLEQPARFMVAVGLAARGAAEL